MASPAVRGWIGSQALTLIACGVLSALGCSSGSSGGQNTSSGGTGVDRGSGGANGPAASGGRAGTGGNTGSGGSASVGTGGISSTGGATAIGGAGGASNGGGGGATGGGAPGGRGGSGGGTGIGSGGAAGANGGSGGAGGGGGSTCVGRVLSLAANGTGASSDAAYSRVVVDLMTALPIGNANRTVEFWAFIKTTDWVGESNEVFEYGAAGTTATAFGLDFGTNPVVGMPTNHATLNPFTNGGFNDDSTNDLGITSTSNQWVHIAMIWDGTALRTYINGALKITTAGTGGITQLATVQSTLSIGCNFQNLNCFNGYFDEFRLWNVARTAQQIMDSYNRTLVGDEPGLVGYWKFDDAPGATTAADSVAGGRTPHPGTLSAATPTQRPTFVTATPPPPLVCP